MSFTWRVLRYLGSRNWLGGIAVLGLGAVMGGLFGGLRPPPPRACLEYLVSLDDPGHGRVHRDRVFEQIASCAGVDGTGPSSARETFRTKAWSSCDHHRLVTLYRWGGVRELESLAVEDDDELLRMGLASVATKAGGGRSTAERHVAWFVSGESSGFWLRAARAVL